MHLGQTLFVTATALRPGTVIDGYEVVNLLGRGGMGAVYRVRRGEAEYAMKALALEVDEDSEEVLRFRREAELLGSLRHRGLVRVSSAGTKPGIFYFVMRLVEGESLEERLKRTGPLPPSEAVRICLAVAEAIAHAHERGVVHRDLKPANILMEKDGDQPVVTDFGLGRQLTEAEADRLTVTGEILGTPSFVAPEQAFGQKAALDEKTDVYGLGALLYTMLSGHPPFEGPSALVVMKKVSSEMPAPLHGAPPALQDFVWRAMAKRREDRPPGARAFMEELRGAATPAPLVSKPVLALVAFALAVLAATIVGVREWRSRVAGLARRIAALRPELESEPLPAARAAAAGKLGDFPLVVRRKLARERADRARAAYAAGSWGEAREAAFDCWLAAPEPPADVEAILVASLDEIAAACELADLDRSAVGALRDIAHSARPDALLAARDALRELARRDAGELVAAMSTSAAGWRSVLQHCEAAAHATSSESLPDDCERIEDAARVLSGRASDLSAFRGRDAASLRAPPLSLAASVLYAAALAVGEDAREEALRRLDDAGVLPPPPFDVVVSDFWWRLGLEVGAKEGDELFTLATKKMAESGDARAASSLRDDGPRKIAARLAIAMEPMARALHAKPDREPLAEEAGQLVSLIRLAADVDAFLGRDPDPWAAAIRPVEGQPLGLFVQGRLLAVHFASTPRDEWPKDAIEKLRSLARRATPAIQRAPRTEHVRALAYDFATKVILNDVPVGEKTTIYPGALEDARPLIELADYSEGWSRLAAAYEAAGETAAAAAAKKMMTHEPIPEHLKRLTTFLAKERERQ